MPQLLQDLRFAARSLARTPGFAAVAVLTLALGIGANAAMFSIVDAVLLRPLPYPEAGALVRLQQANPVDGVTDAGVSQDDFEDWRERTRAFAGMAAHLRTSHILTGAGEPFEPRVDYVTENFFEVMGAPVQLGRPLQAEDARTRARNVVISERLWRTRLGGGAGVVGEAIVLDGEPFTVVGVAPASFAYPQRETDVWAPFALIGEEQVGPRVRDNRYLEVIARLREGVRLEEGAADLARVAAGLAEEHPETNAGWGAATAVSLRESIVGEVDRALVVVLGVVGFILLIACANLANLLLARGSGRAREIAVRTALGADRRRIVQQLLTESLFLSAVGAAAGLVLSIWCLQGVTALSADTLPRLEEARIDARVAGFGLGLAFLTTLLFGLLPALRTARAGAQQTLRGGRGTTAGGQRLRGALVTGEVALAVVLVIGAGLMARSFLALRGVDPGFEAERVLAVSIQFNVEGVAPEELAPYLVTRRDEYVERLGALPGVEGAASINLFPLLDPPGPVFEFRRGDGRGAGSASETLRADARFISPDFFRVMGAPLLEGEPLPPGVSPEGPFPLVINETAARRYWPGERAVGQPVDLGFAEGYVSGVVADLRQADVAATPGPAIYFPQSFAPRIRATFALRAAGDPAALIGPVRAAILEIDPDQPIRTIETLDRMLADSVAQDRFFTALFTLFGGLAVLLASIGIYGVLAYTVSQRVREIGVRMALGARAAEVVRGIVASALRMVMAGVVIGIVAAVALTRLLESQLFGVAPTDPLTFATVPALLAAVAVAAAYLPARRATRTDPATALRAE